MKIFIKGTCITIFFVYFILAFKIKVTENKDIYLRIVPMEKFEFIFLPARLKKSYRTLNRIGEIDKKLAVSKERILYMKNHTLYELVAKEKVENLMYVPDYSYRVSDKFYLDLRKEDCKYFDMVCFRVIENNVELYSSYINVSPLFGIIIKDYSQNRIYDLLIEHKEAKFEITECRNYSEY